MAGCQHPSLWFWACSRSCHGLLIEEWCMSPLGVWTLSTSPSHLCSLMIVHPGTLVCWEHSSFGLSSFCLQMESHLGSWCSSWWCWSHWRCMSWLSRSCPVSSTDSQYLDSSPLISCFAGRYRPSCSYSRPDAWLIVLFRGLGWVSACRDCTVGSFEPRCQDGLSNCGVDCRARPQA